MGNMESQSQESTADNNHGYYFDENYRQRQSLNFISQDEEIIENLMSAYQTITNALPTKKENVRSVLIKLTMSKPIRLEIK